MKTYTGTRTEIGCIVHVTDEHGREYPLRKRLDLCNHSPTGFEWGYGGSGPAQLALALLADVLGDDELAVRLHQRFKFAVISLLPRSEDWKMDEDLIRQRVSEIQATK